MESLKSNMITHLVKEGKDETEVKQKLDACKTQLELRNEFIKLNK